MSYTDPFKQDTSRYKQLLDEDSGTVDPTVEVINDQEDILDRGTVKGLPPSIFHAVKEQQRKLDLNQEKKKEVAAVFNNLFSDLNSKYGLEVSMNFDSFTGNLSYMIEPNNKRAAEYYLSEAYGSFRVALYGQFLQAIALLASQILDPQYLLSESMTYEQKLDTMDRLYQFMATMNEIYKEVNIPDTEMKLEKMSSAQRPTYRLDDPNVRAFMENTFDQIKSSEQ
jgi:hypothetical protein